MRRNHVFALVALVVVLPIEHVAAEIIHESQRILPNAQYSLGSGGFDGETLLRFARRPSSNSDETIRVFKRGEKDVFEEVDEIPGTPFEDGFFGSTSSVYDGFALMGGAVDGYLTPSIGRAGLYQQTDTGWNRLGGISGSGSYDYMGSAVDLDAKSLIIGSRGMSNFNFNFGHSKGRGAAYVGTTETSWDDNWKLTRLAPSGIEFWDFGAAVAVHGSTAVVGAPGDGREPARAWVFERDGAGRWNQATILQGDFDDGSFGRAVDVRDDMIVVGDPYDREKGFGAGAAFIFRRDGGSGWTREAKLTQRGPENWGHLGSALRIGEDGSLLVSAPGYSGEVSESGAAFLFAQDDSDQWNLERTLLPSVPQFRSNFGYHVEYRDGIAVISADEDHRYLGPTGTAYIFRLAVPEPAVCTLIATAALLVGNLRLKRRRSFAR